MPSLQLLVFSVLPLACSHHTRSSCECFRQSFSGQGPLVVSTHSYYQYQEMTVGREWWGGEEGREEGKRRGGKEKRRGGEGRVKERKERRGEKEKRGGKEERREEGEGKGKDKQ